MDRELRSLRMTDPERSQPQTASVVRRRTQTRMPVPDAEVRLGDPSLSTRSVTSWTIDRQTRIRPGFKATTDAATTTQLAIDGERSPAPRIQRSTSPRPEDSFSNRTGMPDQLKAGIEQLSGFDLSAVRVRYNSAKPAALGALAYARGTDIEIGPRQERHLAHEAWHVVQQMQGRVRPAVRFKGVALNDDDDLEREADLMAERATRRAPSNSDPLVVPRSAEGPVQRKVGFEFEVGSISTTKTTLLGRNKLKKQDPLVTGVNYTAEADEETAGDPCYANPRYSGYSDLEFVTSAFPVTVAGFGQLTTALTEISAIIRYISTHTNTDIAANNLPHGAPTANRYARWAGVGLMMGKPQATIGLRLTALDTLFRDISLNAAGGAAPATSAQELFGGGLDPYAASAGGTAAATGLASVTRPRAAADAEMVASLPAWQHSPELVALITQLILYLDAGQVGAPGYGKTIAGSFMMRTAFDRVYRELPAASRTIFDPHPDIFASMVGRAARRVNAHLTDTGDVFSGGIYNDAGKYGLASAEPKTAKQRATMTGKLARRAWMEGIASGTDRLTQAHFPSQKQSRLYEIESLGRYGANTDPMGAQHLPVLELRGLPSVQAGLFALMAMDIFRYVFAMNTAAAGGNPGQLQAVGLAARTVLANPADPNYAVEMANAVAAAAGAVAAWGGAATGGD